MKDNRFKEFCYILPNINMNQPQVYRCPHPLATPSHLPYHFAPLGCYRVPFLSSLSHTSNSHWLSSLHRYLVFRYHGYLVSMLFCLCFLIQYLVCHSFPSKEQVSFNFMAAVILELNKMKFVTASTFSPSICHEVMESDAMILVFWMLSFKPAFSLSSFTLN